jgi:hypothetical protein
VVEAIVEGHQPPDLTLQTQLIRYRNLSLDWTVQQRALGIG